MRAHAQNKDTTASAAARRTESYSAIDAPLSLFSSKKGKKSKGKTSGGARIRYIVISDQIRTAKIPFEGLKIQTWDRVPGDGGSTQTTRKYLLVKCLETTPKPVHCLPTPVASTNTKPQYYQALLKYDSTSHRIVRETSTVTSVALSDALGAREEYHPCFLSPCLGPSRLCRRFLLLSKTHTAGLLAARP